MGTDLLRLLYVERHGARDAMAPHMPELRKRAAECESCVEFGLRRANSTVALLMGCKGEVHSYDIELYPKAEPIYRRLRKAAKGRWHVHLQNSVTAEIPPCDLLLHDSLHNYYQVSLELGMHAHKVRKYICFHDTHAHGLAGQHPRNWAPDPKIKGLEPAIEKFLEGHPWEIAYRTHESNGFLVLQRTGDG